MASLALISPFHRFKEISSDECHQHKPVYYGKNGNYIFIPFTTRGPTEQGEIWKYDLDKQIITEKYKYPEELDINDPEIFIDIDNDIIYTLNGYEHLILFDLKTKQWNTSICYDDILCSQIISIPSPINQIHLTMNNTHYKFDIQNKNIIKLQQNIGTLRDNPSYDNTARFIYSQLTKQLFMFQSNCEYILFCEINDKHQKSVNWKKFEIQLPGCAEGYHQFEVILAWNKIIFWFYNSKIWCLDLFHSNKWYQSNYFIPKSLAADTIPFTVVDKDNNVHFISMIFSEKTHKHYGALLYDLLPLEIIELNKIEFDPLVIGFIKQCEKNKQYPFVPIYLKKLVLEFYPIFL
eukprot:454454_1